MGEYHLNALMCLAEVYEKQGKYRISSLIYERVLHKTKHMYCKVNSFYQNESNLWRQNMGVHPLTNLAEAGSTRCKAQPLAESSPGTDAFEQWVLDVSSLKEDRNANEEDGSEMDPSKM